MLRRLCPRRSLEPTQQQSDDDRRSHEGERNGAALFKTCHGASSGFVHAFQASQLF
jgi:hypothetical protein